MSPVQANLWKINFIFRCDAAPNSKLSFHAIIITPGCSWFSFNKTLCCSKVQRTVILIEKRQ
jgi:hypothetical protein